MHDCCSAPDLLPFEQALSTLVDSIESVTTHERVSLDQALDRVLASGVVSPIDVPPHHNSAMDGYAFNAEDIINPSAVNVVGKSFAGSPYYGELAKNECIRIMTGAKLPDGCDTVVMQENVEVNENVAAIAEPITAKRHVRYRGEDIEKGQPVFNQGHTLNAIDLGVLASLGVETVQVFKKLTVAVLATGDELKTPFEQLSDGDIYESNTVVLQAMLSKLNVNIINFGIIKDDKNAIRMAFSEANKQADIVISSGGVSVGEADFTKEILAELGEINFWKLAIKPGKPFAYGQLSDSVFFGLPGNPVSATVTFHQLAVPGILKMQGRLFTRPIKLKAVTLSELKKSPGRMEFQRGIYQVNEQGQLCVNATGAQGSGILSSLAKANCYIILPQEQGRVATGELVSILPFDGLVGR